MTDSIVDEIDFHAWRTFEHTGWERASSAYDTTFGMVTRQAKGALLEAAHVRPGDQLLDVATGPGYVAAAGSALGASVIGVDFSEKMIESAWWRYPGIQFRKADAEDLPFSDESFDAVVINFGLLHFGQPEKALREAYRVLNASGRLAFTVWSVDDLSLGFGLIHEAIKEHCEPNIEIPAGVPFAQFADADACLKTLGGIGFDQIETIEIALKWTFETTDELFSSLVRGGVRNAAMVSGQTLEVQERIKSSLQHRLEPFQSNGGYELPMPVMLTSAAK